MSYPDQKRKKKNQSSQLILLLFDVSFFGILTYKPALSTELCYSVITKTWQCVSFFGVLRFICVHQPLSVSLHFSCSCVTVLFCVFFSMLLWFTALLLFARSCKASNSFQPCEPVIVHSTLCKQLFFLHPVAFLALFKRYYWNISWILSLLYSQ